jgi:hypothetical protein
MSYGRNFADNGSGDRIITDPLGTERNPWTDSIINLRAEYGAVADVSYGQCYRPDASGPTRVLSPENPEDVCLMEGVGAQNQRVLEPREEIV